MIRRWFCLVPAILGLVLFSAQHAHALEKVRIAKGINTSFFFSGVDIGKETGIWESVGLDVEIITLIGEARLQQALAANSIDIAFGSGTGMGYALKGSPAHAVAAIANQPQNMALIALDNSPVRDIGQLKGTRVGVTSTGSLTDWLIRTLVEKEKWDRSAVQVVGLGDGTARYAAMKKGELQSTVSTLEEGLQLEKSKTGRVIMTFGDIVPHFHTHVIEARDDLIKNNPELIRKVIKGWALIAAYMRDHKAETIKSVAKSINLPEDIVEAAYPKEMEMMSFDGAFSERALKVVAESLTAVGLLSEVPPISALYAPGFVEVKP